MEGNVNHNHNEHVTPCLLEWPSLKRQEISVGKDVEKREPWVLLVGLQTGKAALENNVELP